MLHILEIKKVSFPAPSFAVAVVPMTSPRILPPQPYQKSQEMLNKLSMIASHSGMNRDDLPINAESCQSPRERSSVQWRKGPAESFWPKDLMYILVKRLLIRIGVLWIYCGDKAFQLLSRKKLQPNPCNIEGSLLGLGCRNGMSSTPIAIPVEEWILGESLLWNPFLFEIRYRSPFLDRVRSIIALMGKKQTIPFLNKGKFYKQTIIPLSLHRSEILPLSIRIT